MGQLFNFLLPKTKNFSLLYKNYLRSIHFVFFYKSKKMPLKKIHKLIFFFYKFYKKKQQNFYQKKLHNNIKTHKFINFMITKKYLKGNQRDNKYLKMFIKKIFFLYEKK